MLLQALQQAHGVTDEASAVEALGLKPKLVESESTNFKVTYAQDIRLAELLLMGSFAPIVDDGSITITATIVKKRVG